MTTPITQNEPLPETAAAERLHQHLEEIARERDRAHRALQQREAELLASSASDASAGEPDGPSLA